MATATYDKIATQTLASAASSITFSSIAASWTDLRLVIVPIATGASDYNLFMRFNGDTASNYSYTNLYGTGTSAGSAGTSSTSINLIFGSLGFKTTPSLWTADIFSYAGSTYKTALTTGSNDLNGSGNTVRTVGLWRSTAAITSLVLSTDSGNNFASGTIATLYGIKAA